ncbi:PAS domain S-box-containing protein [Halogranum gelatinilyticum]|uniref:histidine kinase n=1 Tax=Halogranum gelatinilyticum TaxID=660521 RepID=A0A1G9U1Y9_9EURY|nr:HAMP domain-containing sensor histidine kinase [Halogranum gelatinilyticum]SDM53555.1 PAS domain S-box-containing protein [Halogranum gelatinilyticum]
MALDVRVLVVDGDPESRTRTATALSRDGGVTATAVDSTEAALARFERVDDTDETAVDCLVTSHQPPDVDGFALLAELAHHGNRTPVVFYPRDGSETLAGEAFAAGAAGYVPNRESEASHETLVERVRDSVADAREKRPEGGAGDANGQEFAYYRALVEGVMDGAHIIDEDGERVFFNGRSADVHGIDTERLQREAPEIFVEEGIMDAADLESYDAVVQQLLDGERESARVEMDLQLPDIGNRTTETRLTRLDTDDLRGVAATTRDVTDRVATERELETRNRRLANLARFFSHDLRNPLNVASGYATLARETGDSEHFDKLDTALSRMDRLVDDLLFLTTRDASDLDRTRLSLASVAERAWTSVDTADATLTVESDRDVEANEGSLLRLFENVVRNAVTHGGEMVAVTVRDTDDGFAVDDDGPGFPPEPRQLLDVGVSGGDSTGLGLSIVEEVAEAHGWTLALEASPDGGARLRFSGVDTDE